ARPLVEHPHIQSKKEKEDPPNIEAGRREYGRSGGAARIHENRDFLQRKSRAIHEPTLPTETPLTPMHAPKAHPPYLFPKRK
ncbi:hypothetical protein HYS30_02645, partial [Candidatus Peregrinibacteria bacterium]|nr:hypothetical protein [Candidatus Peregrinibacteria bacterium]